MGFSVRGECLQLVFRIAFIGPFMPEFLNCPRKYAVKQFHSTFSSALGYRHGTVYKYDENGRLEEEVNSANPLNQIQEYDGTGSPKDSIIKGNSQINAEKCTDLIWLGI